MSTPASNPAVSPTLRKLHVVRADKVTKKRIPWLWPDYIPLGSTTTFSGFPGNGKSLAFCSIVAAVTTDEPFPDGSEKPIGASDCLVLSLEDAVESVLVPRLEVAGANLERVHIIKSALIGDKEALESGKANYGEVALDTDRNEIRKIFADHPSIRLFVIDPITDFLGQKSLISEQEIRALLSGIETSGVAVLLISHLNKKQGLNAQQRTMGAGALIGKPRANFLLASEDTRKNEFHFLPTKCNYAKPSGLRYSIETKDMEIEGATVKVPYVAWRGKSDKNPDAILEKPVEKKTAVQKAMEFLQALLASGPRPAEECEKAADFKGISPASLKRAKATLGVESKKEGAPNGNGEKTWVWVMRKPFIAQEREG